MDFDEETIARTSGFSPADRRLQLGLSAIIGRPDGTVVEIFPDGTETALRAEAMQITTLTRTLRTGLAGEALEQDIQRGYTAFGSGRRRLL